MDGDFFPMANYSDDAIRDRKGEPGKKWVSRRAERKMEKGKLEEEAGNGKSKNENRGS